MSNIGSLSGTPEAGWVGGFAQSTDNLKKGDLSDLSFSGNLNNRDKITRLMKAHWPEFSWCSDGKNGESSRVFQRLAYDISRVGYDDAGRCWALQCPQMGSLTPAGPVLVEVTITGMRGMVDEATKEISCDIEVKGQAWFASDAVANPNPLMASLISGVGQHLPFPSSKQSAIQIPSHAVGKPEQNFVALRPGLTSRFESPEFTKHDDEAWTNCNVEIQMLPPTPKDPDPGAPSNVIQNVIMELVYKATGNMLFPGNTLTWNVWATAPEKNDPKEWMEHSTTWQHSIGTDEGVATTTGEQRHKDGTPYTPPEIETSDVLEALKEVMEAGVKNQASEAAEKLSKFKDKLKSWV